MYVVTENNKHIIIDFKTDKVENEQELLDRYNIQLKVYKRAINISKKLDLDFVKNFDIIPPLPTSPDFSAYRHRSPRHEAPRWLD